MSNETAKYVNLKINGRLFPTWILANFKKYKLEEVMKLTSGADPCNAKTDSGEIMLQLRKYQEFVSQYLDYKSIYHDILLFHGLGSGKTATTINIYNILYNYTPGWNVFILIKASLETQWLEAVKVWLKKNDYEYRFRNIIFVNYDSPFADREFMNATKNVDSSKKSMYIIEEAHNFINNVYSNIKTGTGKRAQVIYDYIIQDKKDNSDTRVVLLSGTPAINNPFELSLLFNLLRPGIFPTSESEFNRIFVSSTFYQTINPASKNMFQRRIQGLVSYYLGATPDVYAETSTHYIDIPMSKYQEDIYGHFEEIETKAAMSSKGGKGGAMGYKSYTRQACNFVFPPISQKITGEGRPRPGKFRLSEREAMRLSEIGQLDDDKKGKAVAVDEYMKAMKEYTTAFDDLLNDKNQIDIRNKHMIMDDINLFKTKYDGDFRKFAESDSKKSELYGIMYMCSPKMTNILFLIMISPGPTVVYSNYVYMEGLEIFKIYLKYLNFYSYILNGNKLDPERPGYVEFHGGIKDRDDRFKARDVFNMKENFDGKLIKIILISPAGAEGLNLRNVRQIHIMEPYWNEVRITQMIGRGVRQCSHSDLPMNDRHVDIYRYKSIKSKPGKITTDQYIENMARSKDGLIQSFLDAIKEAAIDCKLFAAHNMLTQDYKCFQFNEPSLFESHIGPAYKEDIADDIKMDNGSNSTNSITKKIKVYEIKAVMVLSGPDSDKVEYSDPAMYWLYSKTSIIYDYDLHYPVGRIAVDDNGIPDKLDKDTYKIDYMIPIPLIKDN